jgi:hypothetical protein
MLASIVLREAFEMGHALKPGDAAVAANIRFLNPDTLYKPPGYSHVVEATGPGRTVYIAGQLGLDKNGGPEKHQMKTRFSSKLLVAGLLAVAVTPGFAHHSFTMVDRDTAKLIVGKVVEWHFNSPHAWL